MQIAMITGWFLNKKNGSGASIFIRELKEGLEEKGVQVDLITPQFLGLNNYYLATFVRFFKNLVLWLKPMNQYDLIVCFDYDGFAIRHPKNTPVVCCPRGIYRDIQKTERGFSKVFVWFQALLEQINLSRADYVIANSIYSKQSIGKYYGVQNEKIEVIYTGIDIKRRLTPLEMDINNKKIGTRFLSVGKMYPRKNIPLLMRVFDIVYNHLPQTELHLVGDGIEYKKVIKLKEGLNSKDQIKMHGFVSNVEYLKEIYVGSDVVCHFSEQEAFGNVVLESLALGKPVFALDTSSLPEQVQDGYNGLLFNSTDPETIAKKIIKHIEQPNEIARWGENALKSSKLFTKEKMIENFYSTFQRISNSTRTRRNKS